MYEVDYLDYKLWTEQNSKKTILLNIHIFKNKTDILRNFSFCPFP